MTHDNYQVTLSCQALGKKKRMEGEVGPPPNEYS